MRTIQLGNVAMETLEARLKQRAHTLGFELAGIAPAGPADSFDRLRDWLENGFAGEMSYMHRHGDARRHPDAVLPQVRSVVMLGMNYKQEPAIGESPIQKSARVARYALGIACIGTPIMAPPVEAQQRARPLDRHLGKALAAAFPQRPLLVRAKPPFWTVSRAWRRKWFSRVARPKAASSAAMRAWGSSPTWRVGSGSRQAFSPWAWYWSRQRRSSV